MKKLFLVCFGSKDKDILEDIKGNRKKFAICLKKSSIIPFFQYRAAA